MSHEQKYEQWKLLYPKEPKVDLPPLTRTKSKAFKRITEKELVNVIMENKSHKAPGPSGIAPLHMKYLVDHFPNFVPLLTRIFNSILDDPDQMVPRFKPLFEFRACFLPKYER